MLHKRGIPIEQIQFKNLQLTENEKAIIDLKMKLYQKKHQRKLSQSHACLTCSVDTFPSHLETASPLNRLKLKSKLNHDHNQAQKLKKVYSSLQFQMKQQAFTRKNPENRVFKQINNKIIEAIVKRNSINFELNRQITNLTYHHHVPKNRYTSLMQKQRRDA